MQWSSTGVLFQHPIGTNPSWDGGVAWSHRDKSGASSGGGVPSGLGAEAVVMMKLVSKSGL